MGLLCHFKSCYEDDGISTETRHLSPSHYVFKIENFSLFSNNKMEKYETSEFEAGKCKWTLIIYPNGDPSRNGKGYLSLFLRMVDANALQGVGGVVNAIVRFFLYDQNSDRYYTAGKARRFHSPNLEWGISKFLPLSTFKEPSNGYLVDDKCILGVEVFVIEDSNKSECLTLMERSINSHSWEILDFSTLSSMVSSEPFSAGHCTWKIWLFPKGDGLGKDQSISVFLWMSNILKPDQKVYVEFAISLCGLGVLKKRCQASHFFSATSTNWGWPSFLPLATIQKNTITDSFTIKAEVSVLGAVNKFL